MRITSGIGTDGIARHVTLDPDHLYLFRPLDEAEQRDHLDGHRVFPGAIETEDGISVPDDEWHVLFPVGPGGHVGGDVQIGDGWGVAFARALTEGFAVVSVDCYVVTRQDEDGAIYDEAIGAQLDSEGEPIMWVQTMIHWSTCTNLDDLGMSETWADVTYDDEGPSVNRGADLDIEARMVADDWAQHFRSYLVWDGTPH